MVAKDICASLQKYVNVLSSSSLLSVVTSKVSLRLPTLEIVTGSCSLSNTQLVVFCNCSDKFLDFDIRSLLGPIFQVRGELPGDHSVGYVFGVCSVN